MNFFQKCKSCSIIVGNGSGVLFQPNTDEYSYILTAKHNQFETEFDILDIYKHEALDIAIIKIEKIDMESSIVQIETPEDQEQYKFYGYPENRRHQYKKIQNFDLIVTDVDNHEIIVRNIEYAEQKDITGCSGGGVFREKEGLLYLAGIECRMDMESEEEDNNIRLRFISIKAFDEIVEKYSYELVYLDDSKNFNKYYSVEEDVIDLGSSKSITIKTIPVDVEGKILNVSIFPVSYAEYDLFCEETNNEKINTYIKDNRDKYPVVKITLDKAVEYCKWLSQKSDKNYRLPTSSEWRSIALQNMPKKNLDNYIWHKDNSDGEVQAIGINKAGLLGIYDLYGNVEEICSDDVTKGFSYFNNLKTIINIKKHKILPSFPNKKIGFRILVKIF